MTSKGFTFHEALKDSPNFRFEINQHERYFDRMQKRLEETVRTIEAVVDQGQAMISSFYNLTVALNRLWNDMQMDEMGDEMAIETYKQISDSLSQILALNRSFVEHSYPTLKAGFDSYLKRELGKLNEVKSHFNSLSGSLSEALSKKAAISKHKSIELHDAENSLTAIGTCFSHTGLDYVAQINIAHALKSPVILETLWVFIKEYGNFFTRGGQIFAEQQEFLIGDSITKMRSSYKQIERKMQDRHTFVPKEIFHYPSGIPTDPECIMEGYLFKRATNAFKTWNRRWFMIKDGKLLYSHKSNDGEPEVPTIMEDNLKLCLVRPAPANIDRACCFELVTPSRNHFLQADSDSLCNAWIRALQRTIQNLHEDDHGTYAKSRQSFIGNFESTSSLTETSSSTNLEALNTATSSSDRNATEQRESSSNQSLAKIFPLSNKQQLLETAKQNMKSFLHELINIPGNERCADCGCPDAKWTSLNLGIIICIQCSGVHRSLGVHFSKVRSLTMDTLEPEQRNILLQLGNKKVNEIFLRNLPTAEGENVQTGIQRHTNRESREQWIIAKYVEKKFVRPLGSLTRSSHSRSISSLNGDVSKHSDVKLRNNKLTHHLNLPTSKDSDDAHFLDTPLSRNSFGSDSNLVQSAKAVIAQRTPSVASTSMLLESLCAGILDEVLRRVVQDDFDVNAELATETCASPLHVAVVNHQTTLIEFLLLNGAKINSTDAEGNTPLHLAADRGHAIIVYQLLKRSAEKTQRNIAGKTPLELAIEKCHADIVTLLRLHDMKEEFNDDQNLTMDETVEDFIGDLTAKKHKQHRNDSQSTLEMERQKSTE